MLKSKWCFTAGSSRIIKIFCLSFLTALFVQAGSGQEIPGTKAYSIRILEPNWTKALGGDAISPVKTFQDRIYILGTDRSITCLSEKGNFLWRKPLGFKPAPLFSLSGGGLLHVFSGNGEMLVFSSNGMPVWNYSGKKGNLPVIPPFEGRDGRIFLLYEDEIICLASNGLQKWRRPVNGGKADFICEDGSGNVIICSGNRIIPVSPWGNIFNETEIGITPSSGTGLYGTGCAFFVPVSESSCRIIVMDLNPQHTGKNAGQPDILWESQPTANPAAVFNYKGTFYYAGEDGKITLFNATDGKIISSAIIGNGQTGNRKISGASFSINKKDNDERIILSSENLCAAVSPAGEILWVCNFTEKISAPVFTENGFVISAPVNTVMRGFLAEFSLGARKDSRTVKLQEGYGIFDGKSSEYGITYRPGVQSVFPYFENIREKMKNGDIGPQEIEISRRLAEIVKNDTGNPFSDVLYTEAERSQAAVILGEMGSEEARSILLENLKTEKNSSVVSGILYGIAALGPEKGRETFETVSFIIHSSKNYSPIHRAACSVLYSMAKNSPGDTASEAMKILFEYTKDPYDNSIKKYAKQMLENLLK